MYAIEVTEPILKRIPQHHDMEDRGNVGRDGGVGDLLQINSDRPDLAECAVRIYQLARGGQETVPSMRC